MFYLPLTADLSLRLLLPEHAPALFVVVDANRDHIRPWLPWVDATKTSDDTLAFIRKSLGALAAGEGITAGIFVGQHPIGVLDFHAVSRTNARAEIGYWLACDHQGRGYMTRAVASLVEYGFGPCGLHRIVIKADIYNARSRAIPDRLGFTLEGIERGTVAKANGGRSDHAVYSLLRNDRRPDIGASRPSAGS